LHLPLWIGQNGEAGYPWMDGDTVVVPEVMWPMPELRGARQILFLQNYIWMGDEARERIRREQPEILVCSRYLFNWCTRELGVRPIGIVTPFLDDDVWDKEDKVTGSVLLFSRRNPALAAKLYLAIMQAGYSVHLQVEPVSQRELRQLFNHREFYIHHVEPEGFPMAALEAMRCGVIPVGTTGGGGNEFMFNDETALTCAGPIIGHYSDSTIFVDKVLSLLDRLNLDADLRSKMWQKGHNWSLRYTAAATTEQLRKIFSDKAKEA
jgi:glycosyltransferase involved in cell wall biosynthesis